ncbi:Phospholipase A-2-activating protein [Hypsibius exemplaris]|uniref:Phospholipase A-2-activating protein n=1 Tax=Hypsibius exemplaris TaxID=2072580 RepID=A0A1W0WA62_HYPEX|nr:Phospholipase A-2-activating protein [Hypsibius exemplaris]
MSASGAEGYKLRATLTGHSGDVRAICPIQIGSQEALLSGSRDKTCLVFALDGLRFKSTMCFKNHQKYISSVGYVPPNTQHQQGLILSGSHDKLVHVYDPLSAAPSQPIYSLTGHKDAVSCIASHHTGMVLTGSWDSTAKLWQDSFCVATIEGHELAVWAVQFVESSSGDGDVLLATGSADKTIRVWNKSGGAGKVLRGHTDVVRGLVSPRPNELLSCANDASVRQWDISTGSCLGVYYGHTNYIYSIALLGSDSFVTSSEDASVRVWKFGKPDSVQTIRLPTRSVWAVATLRNGDIAAGGSDSLIRIFTRDNSRVASDDELKAYETELASMEHATKEVLEGVKTEDLPTDAALYAPGEKDGQTKIIRKDGKVEVYNWSAMENEWKKIGDVVGSSNEKASGRTLYQGREYDYVFSVDFDESKPPVKLPYNRSDDPYVVAQKFLEDNELPQSYLDTVAKFIMQNVPGSGSAAPVSAYADPFTGAGRYMPGGGASANGAGGGGAAGYRDPFTGGNAYVSGSGGGETSAAAMNGAGAAGGPTSTSSFYPVRDFIGFHLGNVDGVLKKLKENMDASGLGLPETEVAHFRKLMEKDLTNAPVSESTLNTLGKALDLPDAQIFPALDLLRFAIRHRTVCDYFCEAERGGMFISFLLPLIKSAKFPANQQLSLKVISNTFAGSNAGRKLLMDHRKAVFAAITEAAPSSIDKNAQIARATVLLNFAVLSNTAQNQEEKLELMYVLLEVAKVANAVTDDEAVFRTMVALGTLLSGSGEELKGYAKALDVVPFGAVVASGSSDDRIKSVWKSLEKDLA